MDADRFDRLTRSLNATPTRRHVSHALAGLTLNGMLVPLFFLADAEARKKRKKGRGDKEEGRQEMQPENGVLRRVPGRGNLRVRRLRFLSVGRSSV